MSLAFKTGSKGYSAKFVLKEAQFHDSIPLDLYGERRILINVSRLAKCQAEVFS